MNERKKTSVLARVRSFVAVPANGRVFDIISNVLMTWQLQYVLSTIKSAHKLRMQLLSTTVVVRTRLTMCKSC